MFERVWQPSSAEQIEGAALTGSLSEGPQFDAKAQLPSKNAELAKDVVAMTVDGGTLLYGVAEDSNGNPTVLSPIDVNGAPEKIDQIIQTSIAPPPSVHVRVHRSGGDPSKGYVVVHVPASPLAPHQLTVGGDDRFYGRGATGNRRLTEGEIARLYERRQRWDVDRNALLEAEFSINPPDQFAFLHGFVRPAAALEPLLEVASNGNELAHLQQTLDAFRSQSRAANRFSPTLADAAIWHRRGATGWITSSSADAERDQDFQYIAHVEIDADGTSHLFLGRAGEVSTRHNVAPPSPPTLYLFRDGIVDTAADFFLLTSLIWGPSGYSGPVDLGLGLRGTANGVPYELLSAFRPPRFTEDEFRKTARVQATDLETPDRLAEILLQRFLEATGRNVDRA
jgi:hypothetical protein